MQKRTFYLRMKDGYKLVNGYIDTINGVEVGFHKSKSGYWQATHVKTGYCIIDGCKLRKDLVECLPYWLEKIEKEVKINFMKKAVKDMQEFLKTVS